MENNLSEKYNAGLYARKHCKFLKEHHLELYNHYRMSGTLNERLAEIDVICEMQMESLMTKMAENENVNEELKSCDQMKWVGLMNNIRHRAEEIILNDYVYQI